MTWLDKNVREAEAEVTLQGKLPHFLTEIGWDGDEKQVNLEQEMTQDVI